MSNYLKKLAYVHEAMKKMAASNEHLGMPIEMPMNYDLGSPTVDEFGKQWGLSNEQQGLLPPELEDEFVYAATAPQTPSVLTPQSRAALGGPNLDFIEPYAQAISRLNNVASMIQMQQAYQWDPNSPVSEEIPVSPQPTLAGQYDLPYKPQTKAPPRSIITSPGESQDPSPRPVTYNNAQLQRVRDYQNALIDGMMYRDGLTKDQAIQKLKDNGRWYKINKDRTITVNMGPKSQPGRFLDIINGKRTAQDIKWRGGIDPYSDMATPASGSPRAPAVASGPASANTVMSKSQRPAQQPQSNLDTRINAMTSDKNTGDPIRNRVTSAYLK